MAKAEIQQLANDEGVMMTFQCLLGFSLPKIVKQMPYWMMGYWLGLVTPPEVAQVAMIEIITSWWLNQPI